MKETNYWGHHLVINAGKCDHNLISDGENIRNFAIQLVEDIDMVAYGEPQVVMFGSGDKAGYTLVQLIETSNICAHFVEEYNEVYLDVFSCKRFDINIVVSLVKKYFGENSIVETLYFDRKAPKE